MANMDAPFGMRPKDQGAIPRRYWAASGAATFYAGGVACMNSGVLTNSAALTAIVGVVAYHVPTAKPTQTSPDYDEATVVGNSLKKAVYVYDDPNEIFLIQSNGSRLGAQSYIGFGFGMLGTADGNDTTLQSINELDSSTFDHRKGATSNKQLVCVGVADIIGRREYNKTNPVVEVKFGANFHFHGNVGTLS
jgi:hypothetical protein